MSSIVCLTVPVQLCFAGFICCDVQADNSCPNTAKFDILAWVTTKGYFKNVPVQTNDGGVLLVKPATEDIAHVKPFPLNIQTFDNGFDFIPQLDIRTSGFPCADPRFEGCNVANGLTNGCTQRRGYVVTDALPILDSNNLAGDLLVYEGSSCGGHSGGPLSAPDNQVGGFGILISGPSSACNLPGGTSGSTYSQVVSRSQANGVFVDDLANALISRRTTHALPSKKTHTKQPAKKTQPPKQV